MVRMLLLGLSDVSLFTLATAPASAMLCNGANHGETTESSPSSEAN